MFVIEDVEPENPDFIVYMAMWPLSLQQWVLSDVCVCACMHTVSGCVFCTAK